MPHHEENLRLQWETEVEKGGPRADVASALLALLNFPTPLRIPEWGMLLQKLAEMLRE